MRCLSLYQPWASLMVHGLKRIETRSASWASRFRPGVLLVHAAKRWDRYTAQACQSKPFYEALDSIGMTPPPYQLQPPAMPFGSVVGAVRVLATVSVDAVVMREDQNRYIGTDPAGTKFVVGTWEKAFGDYSDPTRVAVVCNCPVVFPEPIPYTGRQGLFDVPDEVIGPTLRAMEETAAKTSAPLPWLGKP